MSTHADVKKWHQEFADAITNWRRDVPPEFRGTPAEIRTVSQRLAQFEVGRDIAGILAGSEGADPDTALKMRDMLLPCLSHDDFDPVGHADDPARLGAARALNEVVHQTSPYARVTIWEQAIWNAALNGHQAFEGQAYGDVFPEGLSIIPPQIWLFRPWYNLTYDDIPVFHFAMYVSGFIAPKNSRESEEYLFAMSLAVSQGQGFGATPLFCRQAGNRIRGDATGIVAALRFMDQEFVTRQAHAYPRHVRRAAETGRRPALPPETNVVTLRRAHRESEPGEGTERDWQHQWLVSGHWRQLRHPRYKKATTCYVKPHVRGPEGKPFKASKGTVWQVRR